MNSSLYRGERGLAKGFSLLEMLVAMAVFVVLMGLVAQAVFTVTQATRNQKKQMTSFVDARQSLDRFSLDWSVRVRNRNIPAIFTKQTGNDQLGLLSEVSAYSGTRRLAALMYRVNTATHVLDRGVVGYNWQDDNPVFKFPFTAMPTFVDHDYETLGSTVFRLEFCLFRKVKTGDPTLSPYTVDPTLNLNSPDLAGVVIGLAALDDQSRKLVTSAQMDALTQALPDVTIDGTNPLSLWVPIINNPNFAQTAGVPTIVASNVRVFQRMIYIDE